MNYAFETAVSKLQRGCENELSDAEKETLELFRVDDHIAATPPSSDDGYAARILKNINVGSSAYSCTNHVSATSNCVERLFSMCKRTMSCLRKSMGPESLEGTVLLRMNSDLWLPSAASFIQQIMEDEAKSKRVAASNLLSPDVSDLSADMVDEVSDV